MSLKIRLARHGAKKKPYYHIVIADARAPRDGRFIEKIGHFNPVLPNEHAERLKIEADKAKEWLAKGAQPTERVARFLGQMGIREWKHGNNLQKAEPGQKAKERAASKAEKTAEAPSAA